MGLALRAAVAKRSGVQRGQMAALSAFGLALRADLRSFYTAAV